MNISLQRRSSACFLSSLTLIVAACGGGSGGGSATSTPPPTVSVNLSATKAFVNTPVTLTWASTNATVCQGTDAWTGEKAANGSLSVSHSAGGQFKYTITCTGSGGAVTETANLTVPMQVFRTSYENRHNIAIDNPRLPYLHDIVATQLEAAEGAFWARPVAFADFFQEGTVSAMAFSTFWRDVFPGFNANRVPDSPSKLYFLYRLSDGRWEDRTASLLRSDQSRFTCTTPNVLQVADFNSDGRPDVFLSCTGVDFLTANSEIDSQSDQFVVLSQPDGRYVINRLPIPKIYSHGATVADIDGDGNQDVLTVAPGASSFGKPIVLWGLGDGTFRLDATRFPQEMNNQPIFGITAIPIDGRLRVLVSGNAPGAVSPPDYIYKYGTKVFSFVNGRFELDLDLTPGLPRVSGTTLTFGLALDVIYNAGYYYFWRVDELYQNNAVMKTDANTGATTVIWQRPVDTNNFESGAMKLMPTGVVLSQMAGCGRGTNVPGTYNFYACSWSFSVR